MPRPSDNVHIPLPEAEALRLMLKVKPTDEMPHPGTHPPRRSEANEEGDVKQNISVPVYGQPESSHAS